MHKISILKIQYPKHSDNLGIYSLIKLIIINWKIYAIFILTAFALGVFMGKSTPKSYTSKVQLAPETSSDLSKLGSLGSMASQIGINMPSQSNDAIVPDLYPTVVNSTKFIVDLCDINVKTKDNKINTTLYDYIDKHQKSTPWDKVIGGIFKIFSDTDKSKDSEKLNPFELTKHQNDNISNIRSMISCSVDQKTSVITIQATTQDPLVSAIVVDNVSQRLQKFIISYRTGKARHDLDNIKKLVREAKDKYKSIQRQYTSYADANEDVALQKYISARDELENEMQLRYNIYTQLIQQQQLAEAKLQEKTPVYAVIEPATVPVKKSAPHTMLLTLALIFVMAVIVTLNMIYRFQLYTRKVQA